MASYAFVTMFAHHRLSVHLFSLRRVKTANELYSTLGLEGIFSDSLDVITSTSENFVLLYHFCSTQCLNSRTQVEREST